jgi:hypothetical protein
MLTQLTAVLIKTLKKMNFHTRTVSRTLHSILLKAKKII